MPIPGISKDQVPAHIFSEEPFTVAWEFIRCKSVPLLSSPLPVLSFKDKTTLKTNAFKNISIVYFQSSQNDAQSFVRNWLHFNIIRSRIILRIHCESLIHTQCPWSFCLQSIGWQNIATFTEKKRSRIKFIMYNHEIHVLLSRL